MPATTSSTPNGNTTTKTFDVLIIGAGFGGCYSLYKFRQLGLKAHIFEAGSSIGGVWHWNNYPGARVDSEIPYYQFSISEVWRDWNWSERFPGEKELKAYFKHVDKVLQLSQDITFGANVNDVSFDAESNIWRTKTEGGLLAESRFLICATGSSYRPYYPKFEGLEKFKGQLIHSARYPCSPNVKNKRVAIVGSGATAVQCTQEIAKEASHLTVFIRTASISLPMYQRNLTEFEQRINKSMYRTMFSHCRQTRSGLGYDTQSGSVYELTDAERERVWDELWSRGGFNFNQANYRDYLIDKKANKMMYDFWAKKTGPRIRDPKKREFLVPEKPPFAFGTKRSSLEQDYYECLDQENVDVVDLKATPIERFTESGILCKDREERPFDTIVLATGFDAMTGSLTEMNLRGKDGLTIKERWKDGVFTYLGLCISGCPNMFMVYGPQGTHYASVSEAFADAREQHQPHSPTALLSLKSK